MAPAGIFLYRAATSLLAPAVPMLLRRRGRRGKEHRDRAAERLGHAGLPRPPGRLVWVHGASNGECLAALPLIEALTGEGVAVVVTSGTVTSAELMQERLPEGAVHQFVPIDTPRATRRFLDHWRPDAGLFVDSDLWPNLILGAHARGVKLALVNARMSRRSFEGWRWAKKTVAAILSAFDVCLAQDEEIAERFRKLGAPDVRVVGSLKEDAPPLPFDAAKLDELKAWIGTRPVLLAAQTHPGEDETILPAHDALRRSHPDLLTIIVPRHPPRGPDIAMLCDARKSARRALGGLIEPDTEVYIADTMGELGLFYRLRVLRLRGRNADPGGRAQSARAGAAALRRDGRAAHLQFGHRLCRDLRGAGTGPGALQHRDRGAGGTAPGRSGRGEGARRRGGARRGHARRRGGAHDRRHRFPVGRPCDRPDFWTRRDLVSQLAVALLTPIGWLYGYSVRYRARHAVPYQAAARVVCVGNLTAGGTGKNAGRAGDRAQPHRARRAAVFLTRGYGGKVKGPAFVAADDRATHVGDEPLLLAAVAPVIVSADRAAGAKLAEEHGFDVIIMDDGHQNFSLAKDLSLIVVDAETGFGNSRVLPAGPLREPVAQGLGARRCGDRERRRQPAAGQFRGARAPRPAGAGRRRRGTGNARGGLCRHRAAGEILRRPGGGWAWISWNSFPMATTMFTRNRRSRG